MRFEHETEDLVARIMGSDRLKGMLERTHAFGNRVIESGAAKSALDFTVGFYIGWMTDLIERGRLPNHPIHDKLTNFFEALFCATPISIYDDHRNDTIIKGGFAKNFAFTVAGITAGQFAAKYAMQFLGGNQ